MSKAMFEKQVYLLLAAIPAGQVSSYGQLARLAGKPNGAREVGRLLAGLGPDCGLPWQRVLNAQGAISLPRPGSGELQQALLEAEGIVFKNGRCNLKKYAWPGPEQV